MKTEKELDKIIDFVRNSGKAEDYKEMKSEKLLADFTQYCKDFPEFRFWQALRNWSGFNFVIVANDIEGVLDGVNIKDTFYFEGKNK